MFNIFKPKIINAETTAMMTHRALTYIALDMASIIFNGGEPNFDEYFIWVEQNGEVKALFKNVESQGFVQGECFTLTGDGRAPHKISRPKIVVSASDIAPGADLVLLGHAERISECYQNGENIESEVDDLMNSTLPLAKMFMMSSGLMFGLGSR